MTQALNIEKQNNGFIGRFSVMASPCEIIIECLGDDCARLQQSIETAMGLVYHEAKRIEQKFSRYVTGNALYSINHSEGKTLELDDETARLMDFAFQCYELSDGLFDISSGVLRKVWRFDGSDQVPEISQIQPLLENIGLNKLTWESPLLTLPKAMELDFGGIGKEYAVDCCLQIANKHLANKHAAIPILINFGGDLACNGPRLNNEPWNVGIESVGGGSPAAVRLPHGALATSGDARRYLMKNNTRYSHILNPLTGCSVLGAPRSITIAASTCIEAGLMSTMAMLQGSEAAEFLKQQDIPYWIQT